MAWLYVWLATLVVFAVVAQQIEKHAAMRGSHRKPLSPAFDKGIRVMFFFLLVGPLLHVFPYALLPCLIYLPSYLDGSEKRHGRPSPWLKKRSFWNWFKRRLGLKIVLTGEIDPKGKYVVGFHPHGVLPFCSMFNLGSEVNNVSEVLKGLKYRFLAASMCFYIPAYRDLCLAGGVCDAARYVATRLLVDGYSIMLCPGGATEAYYAGTDTLVLRKRRGFVSLAMQTGASLIPVFTFGENDTFGIIQHDSPLLETIRRKFQAVFGLSLPLITNIIPRKVQGTTVFGTPIAVKQNSKPTDAEVDAVLEQ